MIGARSEAARSPILFGETSEGMLVWMRNWLKRHRSDARASGNPFARDTQPRKLRVLLHLSGSPRSSLAMSMAGGLEGCEALDVWSTRRGGIRRVQVEWNATSRGDGVVVSEEHNEKEDRHAISHVPLHGFVARQRDVWLGWMPDLRNGPLDELDEWMALDYFCSVKSIDLVVTDSPFILSLRPRGFAREVVPPREAVACTGLYRRSRGDFAWVCERRSSVTDGRSGFYRAVSAAVLPNCIRLLRVLPRPTDFEEPAPWAFAQAIVLRGDHALRARDAVHWALLGDDAPSGMWSDNRLEGLADAVFSLEAFLLSLVGAFDAAAQLANEVYRLRVHGSAVSWRSDQKNGLMAELRARRADVAKLMTAQQPARDVLEILAGLRNTIHGIPLTEVHFKDRDADVEELVLAVSEPTGRRVAAAMTRLGGLPAFGARSLPVGPTRHGVLAVEPQAFVEGVLPLALGQLDRIVGTFDVSAFGTGGDGRVLSTGRPGTRPLADARARMLLLAGLGGEQTPSPESATAARSDEAGRPANGKELR